MKENIFVFRLAKGNDSGSPKGKCPLDYSIIKNKISQLSINDIKEIDYDSTNYVKFLHNALWNNNVLRQGWGIEGLDLNQNLKQWIETYMLNGKIFWNVDIECNTAKGRWNIVSRMLRMKQNDFIFIPKTSNDINNPNDYNHFTLCQVDSDYYFDYPASTKDFGHCIKVKNVQTFKYDNKLLLRGDFSAPYLWAITEVKKHHIKYQKFENFILTKYKASTQETEEFLANLCKSLYNAESIAQAERQRELYGNQFFHQLIIIRQDKVRVEIRKETVSHNIPHIHITHSDKIDVSISLNYFSILAGNIDSKTHKYYLKVLRPKKIELNNIWNELNEKDSSVYAEQLISNLGL